MRNDVLSMIAAWLVAIGAINWGTIALFKLNFVEKLFGSTTATVIYTLVGISGVYVVLGLMNLIKK